MLLLATMGALTYHVGVTTMLWIVFLAIAGASLVHGFGLIRVCKAPQVHTLTRLTVQDTLDYKRVIACDGSEVYEPVR